MIGPGLRIIFDHENDRVLPAQAARELLHNASECEIVVRHTRKGRAFTRACSRQVIHWQPQEFELRHVSVAHKALELSDPYIGTL